MKQKQKRLYIEMLYVVLKCVKVSMAVIKNLLEAFF